MNLQLRTHYWTFNCLERLTCAGARGKEQRKERSWEDQERENDPWMKESGNRIHFSNLRWVGCCPAVGLNPLIMFLLVLLVELIIHELMDWIFRIGAIFSSEMFCNIFKSKNNKDEFNLEWHRVWTDPTLEKNMQKCYMEGNENHTGVLLPCCSLTHTCSQLQSSPQSVKKDTTGLWTLWISLVYLLSIISPYFLWLSVFFIHVLFPHIDGYKIKVLHG